MKTIKSLFFFLISSLVLNSCSGFTEAGKVLRNEKTRTTDEFLIQKKKPLSQPPDFTKIPQPGSSKSLSQKDSTDIENILKSSQSKPNSSSNKSSSTENSILDQIKR